MGWGASLFEDFGDQMLTLALALILCLLLLSSFWAAEKSHVNDTWVIVSWNSIMLVPMFLKKFRGNFKKASFKLFLLAWMIIHGLYMAALTRWVPMKFWLILIPLELMAGFMAASSLFGVITNSNNVDKWGNLKGKT